MPVHLSLDLVQLKRLVDQLSFAEKEQLAQYLDKQLLYDEMRAMQVELSDAPLTLEEITEEVEKVREERFTGQR